MAGPMRHKGWFGQLSPLKCKQNRQWGVFRLPFMDWFSEECTICGGAWGGGVGLRKAL